MEVTLGLPNDVITCWSRAADGYPVHDVQMRWRSNSTRQAVYGIDDFDIPQFTVLNVRTSTAVSTASSGNAISVYFVLVKSSDSFLQTNNYSVVWDPNNMKHLLLPKSHEVESKCTSYELILFAIFVPVPKFFLQLVEI